MPHPVVRLSSSLVLLALAACGGAADHAGSVTTPPPDTTAHAGAAVPVRVAVDVSQDRAPISPYIYGVNQDGGLSIWTARRLGGNRLTGYDWENNDSNAGSDYLHESDLYLISSAGLSTADAAIPARVVTHFHDQSVAMGAQSMVTLQMAGYAAADAAGPVSVDQTAPSRRWVQVLPKKPTPFAIAPDTTDGVVYMDELVHALVQRYGAATSATGIRWYSLDNEPALWPSTHPRIHPEPTGAAELLRKSIALASAVKDVDPTAGISGPALYGMAAYVSLQGAPDWPRVQGSYGWFIDYYLDGMRAAEQQGGRRLLDMLDVHWYPEARGDDRITDATATTAADVQARLQAPRTLWDSTYHENSWIAQSLPAFLPLLPRLQQSIARYYPGTRLAISEYDYGGGTTVSGGIAQADVLGAFGRYGVYWATLWGMDATRLYIQAGFRLYRDYDGQGATFGATSVRATSGDLARLSAWASIDGTDAATAHVILLNRSVGDTVAAAVQLAGAPTYTAGDAWGFDAASAQITRRAAVTGIAGNGFAYRVPPLTALHLVLRK